MRTRNEQRARGAGAGCGRRGFTLTELLVVMVIMAIAAALVIPAAMSTASDQAEAAARMLMADLEYAQNYAITTQNEVTVQFSGSTYTLSYKPAGSSQSVTLKHPITHNDYVVDLGAIRGFDRTSISAVSFGGQKVVFGALGAPDNGGAVTVAAGAHAYRVTVVPVTGRVTVAKVP